jgi:hypothetical protein
MPTGGQGGGWGPRAGWGRLLPARDSWPRVRRGSARKGGASRCFPRSGWKGSWGALAGGGAGPYAARPPRGTAPSLRHFPGGVAPDVRKGNRQGNADPNLCRPSVRFQGGPEGRSRRRHGGPAALSLALPCRRAKPHASRLARKPKTGPPKTKPLTGSQSRAMPPDGSRSVIVRGGQNPSRAPTASGFARRLLTGPARSPGVRSYREAGEERARTSGHGRNSLDV